MITRLNQVIHKFFFCWQISSDPSTFLKLIWNSKKFRWNPQPAISKIAIDERAPAYNFQFNGKYRTVFLRTHSGDIAIFYEVFWNKVYELPAEIYKDAKTIVDLGANIGLATLYFRQVNEHARIFALEPEPGNFELLTGNLRTDIINQHVIAICAAIDSEDGEASVQLGEMSYNSMISRNSNRKPSVRTISMQTLLEEFSIERIDILKIDIEGSEKRLFEGETTWLERVNYILIEFHSEVIRDFCADVLQSRNYILHAIQTGNNRSNLFWAGKNN
ncbi:MAG: FkbM family methyltransferase [Bacteroidota bacterium]